MILSKNFGSFSKWLTSPVRWEPVLIELTKPASNLLASAGLIFLIVHKAITRLINNWDSNKLQVSDWLQVTSDKKRLIGFWFFNQINFLLTNRNQMHQNWPWRTSQTITSIFVQFQLPFLKQPAGFRLLLTTEKSLNCRTPVVLHHWRKSFVTWFITQIRHVLFQNDVAKSKLVYLTLTSTTL